MMYISVDRLQQVFPKTPKAQLDAVIKPLADTFQKYSITTTARVAMFVAQAGHESAGFTHFIENLNYGAAGLLATFPDHFTPAEAQKYERKPEAIANRAYANRLGNRDEASGDGWRFRGRGALQITGEEQYAAFGKAHGMSAEDAAKYLETVQGAIESAGWWWNNHNLNAAADAHDVPAATRTINGRAMLGLQERTALFNTGMKVFV